MEGETKTPSTEDSAITPEPAAAAESVKVPESAISLESLTGPDREPGTETGYEDPTIDSPEASGSRQMVLIACALIVGGAMMIGVLNVRSPGKSAAAGAGNPAPPVPVAAAATPETPLPPSAGWSENTDAWTVEARKRVAFELPARNETNVWMKTVRPLLVVRCQQGRVEAFVFTDSPAAMEPQDEDHTVRLSFDGDGGRTERWPDSSTHDALFAPDGAAFSAQIMRAETLRFGYTPHNASPVVAHFDVRGLRERLSPSAACAGK